MIVFFFYDFINHLKSVLRIQHDPIERFRSQKQFDLFVELFVESLPCSIIGIIMFCIEFRDMDNAVQEASILIASILASIYTVYSTTRLVLRESKYHGCDPIEYVMFRIQFADDALKHFLPFIGKLRNQNMKTSI